MSIFSTATELYNSIITKIKTGGNPSKNTGEDVRNAFKDVSDTLFDIEAKKVDKVAGKGLSTEDFTTAEKQKLSSLTDRFKGKHLSLSSLKTAFPTATSGDTAHVDAGLGSEVREALWDDEEGWILGGAATTVVAATETQSGIVELNDQLEAEAAAKAALATGADHTRATTLRGLWWFWNTIKSLALTFAAQITFTSAPKFSSTTASKILKVDGNKDLISGDVALSEMADLAALTFLGNATNTAGKPTAIPSSNASTFAGRGPSNTMGFFKVATAFLEDLLITTIKIANNAVTNDKLAQMPAQTVKSNLSGLTAGAADGQVIDIADALYKRITTPINYSADGSEKIVSVTDTSAARTVTLAPATSYIAGWIFYIKDEGGAAAINNITVAASGTDTIDTGTVINTNRGVRSFYSDGVSKFFNIQ